MFSRLYSFKGVFTQVVRSREFTVSTLRFQQNSEVPRVETREITKDRSEKIPLETSIRYLKSAAYQQTYGEEPVWVPYRRNHKGAIPPRKTRKTCIRGGEISTGNPCPICRDEYLVLHEENTALLKQFVSPQTGAILSYNKTGLCRKRQQELEKIRLLTVFSYQEVMEAVFVIVGGGIAGVSCAESLAYLHTDKSIILLSESALIKTVTNLHAITKTIVTFDVEETLSNTLTEKYKNVTILHDVMVEIKNEESYIVTKNGTNIKYTYLCLCMGAEPKLIPQSEQFPDYIIGIRDTDSVETFIKKLKHCKKLVVVGNGGIASEIVYKIRNTEIHWVVKDNHITATFVDPGAAEFFQDALRRNDDPTSEPVSKRMRYQEEDLQRSGAALGPDWYKNLIISGANSKAQEKDVTIHYQNEVAAVSTIADAEHPLEVLLTNGEKITCDLIVSATGVNPRKNFSSTTELERAVDGGIQVDKFMKTNLKNIYAAGDICNANWEIAKHWFQMKLWTQARQMGCYAAKCMAGHLNNEEILQDFCFEIFTHSTKLFGYKVILLGLYNGQKLDKKYEILLRTTKGLEYIKFVIENHRLNGAVLVGDTDLEEMCENLILNQINLEPYGDDILNPDIDIEDYFD